MNTYLLFGLLILPAGAYILYCRYLVRRNSKEYEQFLRTLGKKR